MINFSRVLIWKVISYLCILKKTYELIFCHLLRYLVVVPQLR